MPSIISSKTVETVLRKLLLKEGYRLTKPRVNGETGVDIIAKRKSEILYIEIISFKSSGHARSRDFFQAFFRAVSRLDKKGSICAIALPERFQRGLPNRVKQYNEAWRRIGIAFPELEIWLIDVDRKTCKRTKWGAWANQTAL